MVLKARALLQGSIGVFQRLIDHGALAVGGYRQVHEIANRRHEVFQAHVALQHVAFLHAGAGERKEAVQVAHTLGGGWKLRPVLGTVLIGVAEHHITCRVAVEVQHAGVLLLESKANRFEPRLRIGIVVKRLDDLVLHRDVVLRLDNSLRVASL